MYRPSSPASQLPHKLWPSSSFTMHNPVAISATFICCREKWVSGGCSWTLLLILIWLFFFMQMSTWRYCTCQHSMRTYRSYLTSRQSTWDLAKPAHSSPTTTGTKSFSTLNPFLRIDEFRRRRDLKLNLLFIYHRPHFWLCFLLMFTLVKHRHHCMNERTQTSWNTFYFCKTKRRRNLELII